MAANSKQTCWIALAISILALVLTLAAMVRAGSQPDVNPADVAQKVYDQILAEVWKEMAPVYRELGARIDREPKSFRELLGPIRPVMKSAEGQ